MGSVETLGVCEGSLRLKWLDAGRAGERSQAVRWGGLELGLPRPSGYGTELQVDWETGSAVSARVMGRCWAPEKGLGRHESASLAGKSRWEERLLCCGPLGLCWAGSKEEGS